MVGGGLMQLIAYGAQDVYLTGRPQMTFWSTTYRRHTNFSVMMESSFGPTKYDRKYANFEIKMNDDSDDFDVDFDMIFPSNINLRNLNKNELFSKCEIIKKKKEKKEKTGGRGGPQMFSYSYRSENAANRKQQKQNQRQIKSQLKMNNRK